MPYSDEEHAALVKAAREEAAAAEREKVAADLTEAHNKVDTLEAEKAAAVKAKEEAEKDAADAKAEAERKEKVAQQKGKRVKAMKELAGDSLGEDYFTEERVDRWAEMADDAFDALLDDFADSQLATVGTTAEEAAKLAPLAGEDRRKEIASILAAHRTTKPDVQRETSAFRGGAPVVATTDSGGSTSALAKLGAALK